MPSRFFCPEEKLEWKRRKKNAIVPERGINKRWNNGGGWPLCVDRRESFAIYLTFYTSVFVFVSANSHKRDRVMWPANGIRSTAAGAPPPNYLQPYRPQKQNLITWIGGLHVNGDGDINTRSTTVTYCGNELLFRRPSETLVARVSNIMSV